MQRHCPLTATRQVSCSAMHSPGLTATSIRMLQIQQNLSAGFLGLQAPTVPLSAPLCADSGAQCEDFRLQLNILEILDAASQTLMCPLRSYPVTPSLFLLTHEAVWKKGSTPRHLKNKNNDDSVEFSGVGGETNTHLQAYRLFTAGSMSSSHAV